MEIATVVFPAFVFLVMIVVILHRMYTAACEQHKKNIILFLSGPNPKKGMKIPGNLYDRPGRSIQAEENIDTLIPTSSALTPASLRWRILHC